MSSTDFRTDTEDALDRLADTAPGSTEHGNLVLRDLDEKGYVEEFTNDDGERATRFTERGYYAWQMLATLADMADGVIEADDNE
jgi:hypothetical protein